MGGIIRFRGNRMNLDEWLHDINMESVSLL